MTLTIGNWILVIILLVLGLGSAIACFCTDEKGWGIALLVITVLVCIITMVGISWWHNNTAKGIRAMKDYQSEMNNGIRREITITAEDGREIFHYEGKCDIETSHENSENYILFESEEGLRYIIYYGVQDTVLIIEKAG